MGKRYLENAVESSGVATSVQWKPFFLNRDTPSSGLDLSEYLRSKYGAQAVSRFERPDNPLTTAGTAVGITFNKNRRVVNTLDGHRIVELCREKDPGKVDLLMENIFRAYFEEAKDISQHATLIEIASSVGLKSDDIIDCLNTRAYADIVMNFDEYVKSHMRVSGVPYFIIESNRKGVRPTVFSGAQVKCFDAMMQYP